MLHKRIALLLFIGSCAVLVESKPKSSVESNTASELFEPVAVSRKEPEYYPTKKTRDTGANYFTVNFSADAEEDRKGEKMILEVTCLHQNEDGTIAAQGKPFKKVIFADAEYQKRAGTNFKIYRTFKEYGKSYETNLFMIKVLMPYIGTERISESDSDAPYAVFYISTGEEWEKRKVTDAAEVLRLSVDNVLLVGAPVEANAITATETRGLYDEQDYNYDYGQDYISGSEYNAEPETETRSVK